MADYTDDLIPTMTSNTAPSGVASADNELTGDYAAWKAMDDTNADALSWYATGGFPHWVQYQFTSAKVIRRYTITSRNIGEASMSHPIAWTFQGSNNGSDWTTLDTQTSQDFAQAEKKTYSFSNPNSYTYYRVTFSSGSHASDVAVGELEMMEKVGVESGAFLLNFL